MDKECSWCDGFSENLLEKRIKLSEETSLGYEVFISDDGIIELEVYLDDKNKEDLVDIFKLERKINYCPICGRKFKED